MHQDQVARKRSMQNSLTVMQQQQLAQHKKRRTAEHDILAAGEYDAMMRDRHTHARKQALKQQKPPTASSASAASKKIAAAAAATETTASPGFKSPAAAAAAGKPSLVGPFVHRWLSNTAMSSIDKDCHLREVINKVLVAATGYSMESAPASLPFPPAEIELDMDQLEELALDLVHERHHAVGEAIRRSYSEIKSRHDEIIMLQGDQSNEREQHRREVSMLTLRHKNLMQDTTKSHDAKMIALLKKVKEMEDQLEIHKRAAQKAKETQAKSLETMMKASILSLRMIRKKEKSSSSSKNDNGVGIVDQQQ
mmetsp:Transcript_26213/g.43770  ORF Transcript_26213/g.43770 Transcript_26213/m.43770 type:complete len:309 (+) Transcript_26213:682-1608(+)